MKGVLSVIYIIIKKKYGQMNRFELLAWTLKAICKVKALSKVKAPINLL